MGLGFINLYRTLSLGFRMNFSLIVLLFPASSVLAGIVLRSKGQPKVYILNDLILWLHILQFLKENKRVFQLSRENKKYFLVS